MPKKKAKRKSTARKAPVAKAQPAAEDEWFSQAITAAVLGVTARRLRQMEKEDWWDSAWRSSGRNPCYDLVRIMRARERRDEHDEVSVKRREADATVKQERAEQERMKTEAMRREREAESGRYLNRDDVVLELNEGIAIARERILQFPKRVARLVPAGKVRKSVLEEVDNECRALLGKLAESFERATLPALDDR